MEKSNEESSEDETVTKPVNQVKQPKKLDGRSKERTEKH